MSFATIIRYVCDVPECTKAHEFKWHNITASKMYAVSKLELLGWDVFSDEKKTYCPEHARPKDRPHKPRFRMAYGVTYCGICLYEIYWDEKNPNEWQHAEVQVGG